MSKGRMSIAYGPFGSFFSRLNWRRCGERDDRSLTLSSACHKVPDGYGFLQAFQSLASDAACFLSTVGDFRVDIQLNALACPVPDLS